MESDSNSNCSSSHSDPNELNQSPRPQDMDNSTIQGHLESVRNCSGGTNTSPNHRISSPSDSSSQRNSPTRNLSPGEKLHNNISNNISNGGCNLELFLQHHRAAVTAYTLAMTKTSTTHLMATSIPRKPHHTIESILGLNSQQKRHQNSFYSHQHSQRYRESSGKWCH